MILSLISKSTGLKIEYIERVAHTASHRYKTYLIPKRTGGTRTIDQPSRNLKFLQVWLVDNLFSHLPVHDATFSYRKGIGIRDHSVIHLKHKYLLKVDFLSFFPSIQGADVRRLLKMQTARLPFQLRDSDLLQISALVCKNDRLTIGAPSSPSISNAVLYDFDCYWYDLCRKSRITYSRYADDLYFSTNRPNVLHPLLQQIEVYLASMRSPRLSLNDAKTEFASKKRKCVVTGLILTPSKKISIGRKKKRAVKSMVFRFQQGALEANRHTYLQGYLSFIGSVEPTFLDSLRRKFGPEVIDRIAGSV